ncbi:MAG: ABC transporter permease [Acidobacteria bacterium]|nr:ABC transporter permease [Acidobacteriota bacterium]
MRGIWRRLAATVFRGRAERDLDDEVRFHLEMQAEDYERRGMSAAEARLAARRAFGGVDQVKQDYRRQRGFPLLDTLALDLRHAVRGLVRAPSFTLAAVLTLTLGVGATASIFSVARAVVFEPLPYGEPERRVMVWSQWRGWDKTWVSEAELFDYRTRCRSFDQVAAWSSEQVNLAGPSEPVRVGIGRVTANTFSTLGVRPALGRAFTGAEDVPGRERVAVLSHGLWQRQFGGEPSILGRTVHLDGVPHTVVGVMPPDFQLPTDYGEDAAEPTSLWAPLAIDVQEIERGSHGLYAAALLAPGATAASATSELRALAANLTREGLYPADQRFSAFAVPLADEILGGVRPAVFLLLGAVAFLLLIACANVASLLLARSETRQRDVALRAALGSSGGRLVRLVLVESLVLSGAGAALGLLLAWAASRGLATLGPLTVPRASAVRVDLPIFAFTALLALATTVLFGLLPALRSARVAPANALREAGTRATLGRSGSRLRGALVVGEIALALVLAVGAGLMIRSLQSLHDIDLGFEPEGVLTARLWLPEASYQDPGEVVAFYRTLLERLRALPGVEAAGALRVLPLGATIGDWGVTLEGDPHPDRTMAKGDWQVATDGAIEALGERLVRGRSLSARDGTDAEQVALVNETMARTYWPGIDPIGRRFRMGRQEGRPWITVVGVVADERHNGITGIVKEKFFRPHSQFHNSTGGNPARGMTLVVRTAGDPLDLARPVRDAVRSLDPTLPLAGVRTMEDVVAASMVTPRLTGRVLSLFALLALTLAAIGIYGVLTYLVSERTHEIGIRMAVGAGKGQVLGLVLGRAMALTAAGLALGLLAAAGLTRLMTGVLHGVAPLDPATFLAVPVLLAMVALGASSLPALRAARVDPIVALRD